MDEFGWIVVGSLAGVAAAVAAIIPLVRRQRDVPKTNAEVGSPTQISSSHGIQVGVGSRQVNQYIQIYIAAQLPPSMASSGDAVVVGEVPQQAPAFQDREPSGRLGHSGPRVAVVRAVTTGMRGVGTTQIAAAYARSCIDAGWRLVAWVNADDSASVLNGLAETAQALGVGQPGADLESIGDDVRLSLEADGERCLVVFDNAADLDYLARFVPAVGQCQIIITSNQLESLNLGESVNVGVFTEQEASRFLAQRTSRPDHAGARELADELGYLPLALAQATAVIAAQHLDYPTYLARLRAVPVSSVLKQVMGDPYARGVAEAVVLALDAVADSDPTGLCLGVLNVLAVLSAAGVSRPLLYAAGQQGLLRAADDRTPAEPESIDQALGTLASASLLILSVDGSTVTAHRLTMRVALERQAQDGTLANLAAGIAGLLQVVTRSLDEPWQNRSAARDAVQQVMAVHEHLAPYASELDETAVETLLKLRAWVIWCLNELGDSSGQAVDYGESVVADSQRILGDMHPDTLTSRNNLARAYQGAGRLDDAIPLFERNLEDCEQILGDTHLETLISRNDLADAYRDAGLHDDAISLHERNLADRERTLGDTHPDTLSSRNDLAYAYCGAGRLDDAIPLFERNLADREQILGDTHPDTLTSRNNLAYAYRGAGRLDEAILLHKRTLADRKRILGDTHPDTLGSRNNLGRAYQDAGRFDEAITLHEQNLPDCEQILGNTHPHTLISRNNLARTYQDVGRLDEAIPLHEQTLADRERILGDNHPDTLTSRSNLARAYQDVGRLDEAIPLHEQTLADRERILGDNHPDTLTSRSNLARAYQDVGRLDDALRLRNVTET